jgi:hypothetical protein
MATENGSMNDRVRELARAEPVTDDVRQTLRTRKPRWGHLGAIAIVGATAAWAIGHEVAKRIENHDIQIASRRQPPAPGYPVAGRTVDNNNLIMRMGLVGDLDGTAVAYAHEADHLVADGKFQIDLPLEQMAALLGISPDSLANPQSPDEIDPNAELFRAQAGTLTDKAKELSLKLRKQQVLAGKKPDAVVATWVITDFSFTLNRLRHPNEQENIILSAIISAAAETMPKPGDKIRAIGVIGVAPGRIALSVGLLPLEAALQSPGAALPYP